MIFIIRQSEIQVKSGKWEVYMNIFIKSVHCKKKKKLKKNSAIKGFLLKIIKSVKKS